MKQKSDRQNGLSMVELLAALAISSFLLLGITQIYLDNKRNHIFRQSQAGNIENSRFAVLLLDEYLGKAGYRRAAHQLHEEAFPETAQDDHCKAFAKGSALTATHDSDGLCLRYQPLVSGEADCLGNSSKPFDDSTPFTSADRLIVLALKYIPGSADQLHQGSLRCTSLNGTVITSAELLSGIADFRLEFGVGTPDLLEKGLNNGSNRFVTVSSWAESTHGPIRAVRYSLLLSSQQRQREGDSTILDNWLASASDTAKARLNASDQNRLYQVAHSTQPLRNLMP